jgi:glycyl-tRNA synthetase beta chain
MKDPDLILEIGVEELPPSWVEPALEQLESLFFNLFQSHRIGFKEIHVYGTPRRLVIHVVACAQRQAAEIKEVVGPSFAIAYQDERPTPALKGFLKKYGLGLDQVKTKKTQRGDYVVVQVNTSTLSTREIARRALPDLLAKIQFPKTMRWESSGFRFARPIRWILCLLENQVVPFQVAGLKSGRKTWGQRSLRRVPLVVSNTRHYFNVLKRTQIILDHRVRRDQIEKGFRKLAHSVVADTHIDSQLLNIVNHLVEQPYLFLGRFHKGYLELPREVLSTSMAQNQRVFSLVKKSGQPMPYFVGIINGRPKAISGVRAQFERILEAKLADSRFFFQEDTRTRLEEKLPELKRTLFQAELGSLFEKSKRVKELAFDIARGLDVKQEGIRPLQRASELGKVDLVTHMVSEFPNLQGVMGREYALADGESREVADAIFEHYLPRFKGDDLPKGSIGRVLSVADRIDTLVGFFGIGKAPTGSFDPFALRRTAQGVVSVILATGKPLPLGPFLKKACQLYGDRLDEKHAARLTTQVMAFIRDRLITVLNERCGRFDIIDAVLSSSSDDLVDTLHRVEELDYLSSSKGFEQARTIVERTYNIIRGQKQNGFKLNPKLFQEPLEEKLHQIYCAQSKHILHLIDRRQYREATTEYGKIFFDVIHIFFDKVMVNVEDDKIRVNRMALLEAVNRLYTERIADLSKIVTSKEGSK